MRTKKRLCEKRTNGQGKRNEWKTFKSHTFCHLSVDTAPIKFTAEICTTFALTVVPFSNCSPNNNNEQRKRKKKHHRIVYTRAKALFCFVRHTAILPISLKRFARCTPRTNWLWPIEFAFWIFQPTTEDSLALSLSITAALQRYMTQWMPLFYARSNCCAFVRGQNDRRCAMAKRMRLQFNGLQRCFCSLCCALVGLALYYSFASRSRTPVRPFV